MYKTLFILILCGGILFSGCKKSCYTCFGPTIIYLPIRYDSSFSIFYDSLSHHNDTLLVKIDTILRVDNSTIQHVCPGNPQYYYAAENDWGGGGCVLDQ
jgi:hypothetical protein